ncbi:MAG: GIY-YIG nuclease family protein [Bacteroidota bacterium]
MFVVYILFSPSSNRTYVGFTNDLARRFEEHNRPNSHGSTAPFGPWAIIHSEVLTSAPEARKREKQLKSGLGRKWIKEYIFPNFFRE